MPAAWYADPYRRTFDLDLTAKGKHPTQLDEAFSSPLIDQNRQYVRYNLQTPDAPPPRLTLVRSGGNMC